MQGGFQSVHHHRMDNGFRNVYRFINNEVKHISLAVRKSLQ
jgi:capsule polysaccharide modification protein KpsS